MPDTDKHVQSNIYTVTDRDVVKRIIARKEWTVDEIAKALPTYHSKESIKNYLMRFLNKDVIESHDVNGENENAAKQSPVKIQKLTWTTKEERCLRKYYPYIGTCRLMINLLHDSQSDGKTRTESAIKTQAYKMGITQAKSQTIRQDDKEYIDEHIEAFRKGITDIDKGDPSATDFIDNHLNRMSVIYNINDIRQYIMLPKTKDTKTMDTQPTSREHLFQTIRELAKNPDIHISVNIDFGDGCMFIWPPKQRKETNND